MFEIGPSLREARLRRGVTLGEVEDGTRIRARYLEALEGDRFDELPGEAYARAFLRSYVSYLGLDAALFMDEYSSRFEEPEEPLPPPTPAVREAAGRILRSWPALIGVAVVVLGAGFGFLGWRLAASAPDGQAGHPARVAPDQPSAKAPSHPKAASPTHARTAPHVQTRPAVASLRLVASQGDSWVLVRRRSAEGPVLYEGTLQPGGSLRLRGRRLWVRFGAPWNLDASLAGKPLRLPTTVTDAIVTPSGLRAVTG